jgi:cytochrome c-type biogenesis protein CcmH
MLATIILALMTGAAVLAVLWPLGRESGPQAGTDESTDAAFYKAQLAEIDRDAERGLIEPAEAETARVEAARRLLAARRRETASTGGGASHTRRRLAAVVAIVLIPALSLGLYLEVGNPGLPGMPLAFRQDGRQDDGMQKAIAQIEAHLALNPEDGAGHEVVGPVYLSMGRYEDAVQSFAAALRILGETPARVENLAEARVAAADGVVTAEARAGFDRALELDPKSLRARFYRGLAAEQDGQAQDAIARYSAMIQDAAPGSPLVQNLSERIVKLGGKPPETAAGAIASLGEKDRDAAIRGMVDQLDRRLGDSSGDVEGWLRLIRAYVVLGDAEKARSALARARTALAGDGPGRERIDALGRELGIGGPS